MKLRNLKENIKSESDSHDHECRALANLGLLRDAYVQLIIRILENRTITEEIISEVTQDIDCINKNEFEDLFTCILTKHI